MVSNNAGHHDRFGAISAYGKLDSHIHPRRRLLLPQISSRSSRYTTKSLTDAAHSCSPSKTAINTHHLVALGLCTPRITATTRTSCQEEETVKSSISNYNSVGKDIIEVQHQAVLLPFSKTSAESFNVARIHTLQADTFETAQQSREHSQSTLYLS